LGVAEAEWERRNEASCPGSTPAICPQHSSRIRPERDIHPLGTFSQMAAHHVTDCPADGYIIPALVLYFPRCGILHCIARTSFTHPRASLDRFNPDSETRAQDSAWSVARFAAVSASLAGRLSTDNRIPILFRDSAFPAPFHGACREAVQARRSRRVRRQESFMSPVRRGFSLLCLSTACSMAAAEPRKRP